MNDIELIVAETQDYQNKLIENLVQRRYEEKMNKVKAIVEQATKMQTLDNAIRVAEIRLYKLKEQSEVEENELLVLRTNLKSFKNKTNSQYDQKH